MSAVDYKMKPSEALKFERPLRAHQTEALDRFANQSEVALFWEMGLGKTTTAISWLRAKYKAFGAVTRTLIVSPVATLYNWGEEFIINSPRAVTSMIFIPYMKTKRTKLTGKERAAEIHTAMNVDARICIINPESLDSDEVVAALLKWSPVNVVIDESHKFKSFKMLASNAKKRTPSRLAKLLQITDKAQNRMIMTGTPILNSYLDLWSQFRILDKGNTFGTNFYTFREAYFRDENIAWKGKPKYFPHYVPKENVAGLISHKIAAKASRLTKDECLDLPELVQMKHYVELSPEQEKAYRAMEKDLIAEVESGVCAATNALVRVGRLLQILSGHLPIEYEEEQRLIHFKSNPRLDALRELLEELTPKHKVIVWAGYRANYEPIRALLQDLKIQWAELTGETKNRHEQIETFQKDVTCRVMVANAQAGGVGVNLTAASYSIYFSRSYSLGDRLQSEARNHRDGSQIHERITLIDLVAKDTLDEDVLAALVRKENFSDKILDRLKARR